ncbi:MAG: Dyp-type peroxidase [Deltaproteobacteria bacterium]|nr:Dyp-type peroxidase [Deltaproteobacteria bacterium]
MPQPQAGIVPAPSPNALFLVLRVRDLATNGKAVAKVAASTPTLTTKIAALDPRAKLVCTVSFGSRFWETISPQKRPAKLRPFTAITNGSLRAPSTGGDLLFHILSKRHDLNFELAMRMREQLGDMVEVMDEVHGFQYLDSRDLTGFIDGTENPAGNKDRTEVALIGKEDAAFAGGSYVFTQRYVHNLKKWATTPLQEQEGAVGRKKKDSKELSEKRKPATAHISRVVMEERGEELEIVRHSFPYGTVSESGLFFIAYTRNLDIPEKMLQRMLGTAGDGLHDHLMDFTQAVTGATFFAPSVEVLKSLGK